ncbi:Kinesin protein [Fasciola gigantica]|uniref:Kinesin protein n=1 Tax=Fasciola gigantica TaxID=46835 RepID=A0A504Z7T6_FASGI|nr:Kinesin protein [Fasciola gigantica]
MQTHHQALDEPEKRNQACINCRPGTNNENEAKKSLSSLDCVIRWKNAVSGVQVNSTRRNIRSVNSPEQKSPEEPGYSNQSSPKSCSLPEHSSVTGLGYSTFSSEASENLDSGSSMSHHQHPIPEVTKNRDTSTENSDDVHGKIIESDEENVSETIENTENVDIVGNNEETTEVARLEGFRDSIEKTNSCGYAIGQRVKKAWLLAKRTLKNDAHETPKKVDGCHLSPLSPTRLLIASNKGDQLRTPIGYIQPWPVAAPFRTLSRRSRSSEDVPVNSAEVLLKNHTESLVQDLKEATLKLARRDMEMQRLLAVNGQLGERYCRIRTQYMELAREQARLRQRYDMLVVKGVDCEQLRLNNSHLEAQLAELQAQLAKAEERANQSTRRLGRVEAEAKDIAQSVTSADIQLANLRIELQRKEAQITALSCRQYLDATRELQARAILNELIELKGNLRVIIRCHENPDEESMFHLIGDDSLTLRSPRSNGMSSRQMNHFFKAHRVFPPGATQRAVFDELSEMITSCVDGYGVSIITYGQTGTGKTYTMLGAPNKPGIIPRAARHLLVQCTHRAPLWTYRLSIAIVQVYKETIIDLLADPIQPTNMQQLGRVTLHDNGRQILLRGAKEVEVHTEEEILEEVRKARTRRQTSAHLLNTSPSYLHFIVILRVRGACLLTAHAQDLRERGRRQAKFHPNGSQMYPLSQSGAHLIQTGKMDDINGESGGGDGDLSQTQLVTHGLLMLCDLAGFDTWNPSQTMLPTTGAQTTNTPKLQSQTNSMHFLIPSRTNMRLSELRPISAIESRILSELDGGHRAPIATSIASPAAGLALHNTGKNLTDSETIENRHLGRSLTTLARVIDALLESENNGKIHIPYRDAKLTHLLKPCLTGDAKCMLIVTLNTQRACLEASLRSLKLASKASLITLGQAKKNASLRGGICTTI